MSLNVLMALFLEERSNVRISTLQDELEANGYMKHINYGTPYLPIHLTAASPPCKQTNKIVYTVSADKNLFADTLDIYCNFHREVRLGGWGLRGRRPRH